MAVYSHVTITADSYNNRTLDPSDATEIYLNGSITFSSPYNDEYYMLFHLYAPNGSVIRVGQYDGYGFIASETVSLSELFPAEELLGNVIKSVCGTCTLKVVSVDPTIMSMPAPSVSPASGAGTTLSWASASVSNLGDASIVYQYYIGSKNNINDFNTHFIGETTSRSVWISEATINEKLGSGLGASTSGETCYFFIVAYWKKTDGRYGGHTVSNGTAFSYKPTVNKPTGVNLTSASGFSTTVKWTNVVAGNGSTPQAILYINGDAIASGITNSNGGYVISKNVLSRYGYGRHSIQIAHEWYGRYSYSDPAYFTYRGTMRIYKKDLGGWKTCEIRVFKDGEWKPCEASYYQGGWKTCE